MSVIRATVIVSGLLLLVSTGKLVAQDDSGFEALLNDITQPPAATGAPGVSIEAPAAQPEAAPFDDSLVQEPVVEELAPVEDILMEAPQESGMTAVEEEVSPAYDEVMEEAPSEPAADQEDLYPAEETAVDLEPAPASTPADAFDLEHMIEAEAPATPVPAAAATDDFDIGGLMEAEPAAAEPAMEWGAETEEAPEAVVEAEEEPAVVKQEPAAPVDPETAKLIAKQEEVRRQARELQGRKSLEAGLAASQAGNYDEAIKNLEQALANIPVRPATAEARNTAQVALGEAYYSKALDIVRKNGSPADARASVEQTLKLIPNHKHAPPLLKRIEAEEARRAKLAAIPVPIRKRPEIVQKQKTISELLDEGRQYFKLGEYNQAEVAYEKVLLQDEYNLEAMRYLRKIGDLRYELRTREREATVAGMIQKVRDTWNAPIRDDILLPDSAVGRGPIESKTQTQRLQEKMEKIVIPSIEFRQANITDVVNFLVDASVAADPTGAGVNIILNLNVPGETAAPSAPAPAAPATDIFGGGFDDFGAAPAADFSAPAASISSIPTITLNLRRITLMDAIKYITEVAGLKFRIEENAVMITPAGVVSGRVVTRLYPVQPSILDVIVEREATPERGGEFVEIGGGRATIKKTDVKDFFIRAGVPFPVGTSITYNQSISQLIVANTPENLETFERILSRLNVTPNQVEIEARFVEINQDDLEELGLQWILTDNWEIAQKKGTGERIQMNADSLGLSKGLRFFNFNSSSGSIDPLPSPITAATTGLVPLGGVATFASVLTNPEVSVIVQALSVHGGTDLLSAPRVTTRSGVNAQIQVVQEIIYPTEFETTQPQFSSSAGDTQIVTPPLVTPGSFKTRETGVILNVTPTVGPDGYTIDLTLVPEVSELLDWIQYGSTFGTFTFNIPQPVFASRNVTTSIVIWDGQTVVMGGLIREEIKKVKDKIPLLGDIPILGRLFRTEGEFSRKKNLLIFVTARLVDPSGKPIHRGEPMGVAEGAPTGAPAATP